VSFMSNHEETREIDFQALQENILGWWRQQEFSFPWRDDALPEWQRLVTEVLLQRTRATAVAEIYDAFFERYPTASDMGAATSHEMRDSIYSLGLLWRAEYLVRLGATLEALQSAVPSSIEELSSLPAVGPYVSSAFLVLHRDEEHFFVDANIVRLLARYVGFECDGETRRKKWFISLTKAFFHHQYSPREFGYAVLDFSREICGRVPQCEVCPARDGCQYGSERDAADLP